MKSMLKEAAILFAITLIAGCLLGLVYQVTKDPIADAKQKAKEEACKEVFSDANSFELVIGNDVQSSEEASKIVADAGYKVDINEVSKAMDASGTGIGYVITVTDHEGYGGDIQFSIGVRNDGTVNGISILSSSVTPFSKKSVVVFKAVARFATTPILGSLSPDKYCDIADSVTPTILANSL